MKVFKELPFSIYHSLRLASLSTSGLLAAEKEQLPVIVSLTSIPSRLNSLHLVIRSLLTQTHHPKKIVLWLNEGLRDQIPNKLTKLQGRIFEICYSEMTCSHRKLIHSMEKYPEDIIITCDDDMIYAKDWLFLLYQAHLKNAKDVIGMRTLHINHDDQGNPLSYKQWGYPNQSNINPRAPIPIGAWGVLYPPHSLSKTVLNSELFLELAPKNDDLWFKAMSLINSTLSRSPDKRPAEPIPIMGSQKVSLKKVNVDQNLNDQQWRILSDKYNLSTIILEGEESLGS